MQTTAKAKFIKISPKKVRLVVDLVRGMDVDKATDQLNFLKKGASLPVGKLLKSAINNAEENLKLKRTNLFIKEIRVDEGPTMHRWMPKAMGRATPIRKRTSHIIMVLDERIPTAVAEVEKAKKEKVSKDDIIKLDDFDKVKADKKKEDKAIDKDKKIEKKDKPGSSKKLFNRRSGER